jgi:hypothetical protein
MSANSKHLSSRDLFFGGARCVLGVDSKASQLVSRRPSPAAEHVLFKKLERLCTGWWSKQGLAALHGRPKSAAPASPLAHATLAAKNMYFSRDCLQELIKLI